MAVYHRGLPLRLSEPGAVQPATAAHRSDRLAVVPTKIGNGLEVRSSCSCAAKSACNDSPAEENGFEPSVPLGTREAGLHLTPRWSERDSNLWSLFEIGTARAGSNDREFVRRVAERPLFSERD